MHSILRASEARNRSDKANGKGVAKFLKNCEESINHAVANGKYFSEVWLHGVRLDDQKVVSNKLKELGYSLDFSNRGASMKITWGPL